MLLLLISVVPVAHAKETINVSFQSIEATEDYYILLAGPAIPQFFIDNLEVDIVKTEIAGGALYAYYYLERIAGDELKITHDEGSTYIYNSRTVDISQYKKTEEYVSFNYLYVSPKDYLVIYTSCTSESPCNTFFSDVSLHNKLSYALEEVSMTMSIPELNLFQARIKDLPPNYREVFDQFQIEIPVDVKSGIYEVVFTADYELSNGGSNQITRKFEIEIAQLEEVDCNKLDGLDYYTKSNIILTLPSGQSHDYEDYCIYSMLYVSEMVCEGNKMSRILYNCPSGCEDGACIKDNEMPEEENEEVIPSVCADTDNGKNYYEKGTLTNGPGNTFTDFCKDTDDLMEYTCLGLRGHQASLYSCPYGCEDGACLEFVEREEEIEVPEEETESSVGCPAKLCKTLSKDCYGGDEIIIEECKVYIRKDNQCGEITISKSRINKNACEFEEETDEILECGGCQLNQDTCIPFGTRIKKNNETYYCSIEHRMLIQKKDGVICQNTYECVSNNCKGSVCTSICGGCLDAKNVCIPFGTRTETHYCNTDFNFKNHKSEDMSCNNNYECSTNVCVDSKCISQNLIQKILSWFKNLFG